MTPKANKLLKDALELSDEERAALAASLIDSLDPHVDEDIDAAWQAEIAQRLDDLDRGRVTTVPWSEIRSKILGLEDEPTQDD